jgi:hypothetical protein
MSLSTGDIPKTTIIDDTVDDDELLRASGVKMDDTATDAATPSSQAASAASASASAPAAGGGGGGGGGSDDDAGAVESPRDALPAVEVTDEKSIVWDKDESAAADPNSKNHKSIAFWTGLALDHLRTVGDGKELEEIKQIDLAALTKKVKFFAPNSRLYSNGYELFVRFSDCVNAFKNKARVTAALLMNVKYVKKTSPCSLPVDHKWRSYTLHEIRKRIGTPIQDDDCVRLVHSWRKEDRKTALKFGENWYIPVEAIFKRLKFSATHDGYGKGKKEGKREVLDDAPFGRSFEEYSGFDENSDVGYGPLRHFFGCLSQFSGHRLTEAFCSANEAAATGDESAESYNSEAAFLIAQTIRAYKHEVSKKTNTKRAREEDGDAKSKPEKDEAEARPAKKPRKANGKKAKDPDATESEKDEKQDEPKAKAKAKPKADADADGDVDMEPKSKAKDAEAKPKAKPKPKAQPDAVSKSADDAKWQEDLAKAKADKEAKTKATAAAAAKAKAKAEADAAAAAKAKAKAKAEADAAKPAADDSDEAIVASLFSQNKAKAKPSPKPKPATGDEDADMFG